MKGVIIKELNSSYNQRYLFFTDNGKQVIESEEKLKLGPYNLELADNKVVNHKKLVKEPEFDIKLNNAEPYFPEKMEKIKKPLIYAAQGIKLAELMDRKILIRYHHDTDGICSALSIYNSIKARTYDFYQKSVNYEPRDAFNDISMLSGTYKPLVLILDLGSSEESVEGLNLLTAAGMEVIVIDHHPPSEKRATEVTYINSWDYGSNSNLPAGVLCNYVGHLLGLDKELVVKMSQYALTGDKSMFYNPTKKDKEVWLVLDYASYHSGFRNSMNFYEKILFKDKLLFDSIYIEASEKIREALERADKYLSMNKVNDVRVYLLKLDKVSKKFEYPSKGKICTTVADDIAEKIDEPYFLIGYDNRLVTLRVHETGLNKGIEANAIIEELKHRVGDLIVSGGGHDKAASMWCEPGTAELVKDEFIAVVKEILEKEKTKDI